MGVPDKPSAQALADEIEDKFHEESLDVVAKYFKQATPWSPEPKAAVASTDEVKKGDVDPPKAPTVANANQPRKYVPPTIRRQSEQGAATSPEVEATLRISNLSLEARDGDLRTLFEKFGRISR